MPKGRAKSDVEDSRGGSNDDGGCRTELRTEGGGAAASWEGL